MQQMKIYKTNIFLLKKKERKRKTKFRATEEESAHVVELKGIAGRFLRI